MIFVTFHRELNKNVTLYQMNDLYENRQKLRRNPTEFEQRTSTAKSAYLFTVFL